MKKLDTTDGERHLHPLQMEGQDHQLCQFIAAPVNMAADCHRAWTYVFPGKQCMFNLLSQSLAWIVSRMIIHTASITLDAATVVPTNLQSQC